MSNNRTHATDPSADTPAQKERKVVIGKGAVLVIGGIAVAAFTSYTVIVLYAIFTAS